MIQVEYILGYLEEDKLSLGETIKLYSIVNRLFGEQVTPEFKQTVFEQIIMDKINFKSGKEMPPESLKHLLPLLDFEKIPLDQVQTLILQIFKQKNFSAESYVVSIGQLLDKIQEADPEGNLKMMTSNLEFWREVISYLDKVEMSSRAQVKQMQNNLEVLTNNIPQLDFTAATEYLEYVYSDKDIVVVDENDK